jgi:hypothetical protein
MNTIRYSIASSLLLAFAATGCAGADESGQFAEKGVEGADQIPGAFDYAPDSDFAEKSVDSPELSGKGTINLTLGATYYTPVTIPAFGTVSYQTSNRVGVDPVLALFVRTNPWGGSFGGSPFTVKGQANTLAFNDDLAPGNRESFISYTNPTGAPINAYLIAFSYDNVIATGSGSVTISGIGTVQITAGSARINSNQGWIGTSASTGDPWLVAIDPDVGGGDTVWNDDTAAGPAGNRESLIPGFTNQLEWVVGHAYSGAGTTTVTY